MDIKTPKSRAFSFVELMISLVIISLVIAAFSPVLTKQIKTKSATGSTGSAETDDEDIAQLKAKTADMFLPFDAFANASKTQTNSDGSYFNCAKATTLNGAKVVECSVKIPSDHVSIVMVGAGAGGSGAAAPFSTTEKSTITKVVNDNLIESDLYAYSITIKGGAASGGSALQQSIIEETGPKYIEICPEGTVDVLTGSGNRYCVTEYNVRPENYSDYHYNLKDTKEKYSETQASTKEIKVELSGIPFLSDGNTNSEFTYIEQNKIPACWIAPSVSCSGSSRDYPACGRTVCNWYAAQYLCSELALGGNNCSDDGVNFNQPCKGRWRLMTNNELALSGHYGNAYYYNSIFGHSFNPLFGNTSFPNCGASGGGTCSAVANTCEGSADSFCYPYAVWGTAKDDKGAYYANNYLVTSNIGTNTYPDALSNFKENAYSVRCVMKKSDGRTFVKAYGGGGGGGGASMTYRVVPKEIISDCVKNNKGCYFTRRIISHNEKISPRFCLFTGETIGETYGAHGSDMVIEIKTSSGEVVWGYKIEGGRPGKSATMEGPGDASDQASLCAQYTPQTGWSEDFECSEDISGTFSPGSIGAAGKVGGYGEDGYYNLLSSFTEGAGGAPKVPALDSAGRLSASFGGSAVKEVSWERIRNSNSNQNFSCGSGILSANDIDHWLDIQRNAEPFVGEYNYSIIYKGGSGGGGGGGAFAHIKNIPIEPGKAYKIVIGGGGDGGSNYNYSAPYTINHSKAGTAGGDTIIYLDNNTVLTARGGIAGGGATSGHSGTNGIDGVAGIGGKFEAVSDSDVINSILNGKEIIKKDGSKGSVGIYEDYSYGSGGNGGASGISASLSMIRNSVLCGGFYADKGNNFDTGCSNQDDANAVSPLYLSNLRAPVKHIYLDGNYGSYGAGGGGGGWKYENGNITGKGGQGQDGYVYFYWEKQ